MGLFSRFSKSKQQNAAKKEKPQSLSDYSGMRVEVMTEQDALLFVGRLQVLDGGIIELSRLGRSDEGIEPPESDEPIPAHLRGFEESTRQAVHMTCTMTRREGSLWRLAGLTVVGKDNDRAFFRQDMGVDGDIMRIGHGSMEPMSCKVVNLSAGGACLSTDVVYEVGDKLLLRTRLLPDSEETPLLCTVRRVTPRKGNLFEYGCKFSQMESSTQDQISKAILQMQMKKIRR